MIKRNTSNFVHKIGDEIVIHSTSTGNNIFLNEVASDIYECVKDGASIDELLSRVGSIYQSKTIRLPHQIFHAILTLPCPT